MQIELATDGITLRVLAALRNRSPLHKEDLERLIASRAGDRELDASEFREELHGAGLIAKIRAGWTLSGKGDDLLRNSGTDEDVEDEELGFPDHPLEPYDVAKLKVESKVQSVFQALRKIEKKEIVLDPEFQRAFVWSEARQSRLIESILIRIPLPAFYLDATIEERWSVVDGLQRLTTLYRFCREESFALSGLEFLPELSGMRFSELPKKYKVLIEDDTQLIFNNLLPGTPLKAKFTIFSRVNTGGVQLTPQEIRHALQQGPITKKLRVLANSSEFLIATGGALDSLRMTDREVIVRALSFMHFGSDEYRKFNDLNAFLMDAMERFNTKVSSEELDKLGAKFLRAATKVFNLFDRYAFRKFYSEGGRRSPFNKALFEAWVTSVSKYKSEMLLARKKAIRDGFIKLMNEDEDFVNSITYATGQSSAVRIRFEKIDALLSETAR